MSSSKQPAAKAPPAPVPTEYVYSVLGATLLLCLIGIIGICLIIKHRKQSFITKRRLSVVLGLNISCLIGMISSFGIIYAQYNKNIPLFTFWIAVMFICWFSIFLFLNVRHYYQYYRYKFQHYTLQLKWQQLINPNIVEKVHRNNWYIHNNRTYGNYSFIYKIFGIIHLVLLIIGLAFMVVRAQQIGSIQLRTITGYINTILFLIPFIIYSIIVCKTPKFNDIFLIHWESKMLAIVTYLYIIGFLAANINITINGKATLQDSLIFSSIRTLGYFAWLTISSFVIIYRQTHQHSTNGDDHNHRFSKLKIRSHGTNDTESIEIENNTIELSAILSNSNSLHLFMVYLSKELGLNMIYTY